MNQLVVQDQNALSSEVQAELEAFVGRRIIGPAKQIGFDLPVIGVSSVVPSGPVYSRTPSGTWAYATDYRADPAAAKYGGVSPIPTAVLDSLQAMHSAGVRPTDLWIAHELDGSWEPGQPLPQTVPPAPNFRRHDQLLVGATEQLKRGLLVAGALLSAAAMAPAALLASSAIGLDPVVVAGVRHPEGPCAWVPLASWDWE